MKSQFPARFVLLVGLFLAGTSWSVPFSPGEELYPGWKTDDALAGRRADVLNAFKAGSVDSDRAALNAFFDNYYFARWTLPGNRGQVQSYARELIEKDLRESTGSAREFFLNKSFEALQKMAADKTVMPSARYNAVLTIGQLAQREPSSRTAPPIPYAQALPYLVREYQNKENPEYVRLAAMLGIVRHTYLGIADETMKNTTIPAMFIETVQAGKPAPERKRDEQEILDWSRLRALDGLGALKATGTDAKVVNVLLETIENSLESTEIRTRAARVLGELDYQQAIASGAAINFQRIGTLLISLAKSTCDTERQTISDQIDKQRASGGGAAMPMEGMGGMGGTAGVAPPFSSLLPEQQMEVTAAVQRLKRNFQDILYGIRGPRWSGATTIGIVPMLPSDDPIASKLNTTAREMNFFFRAIDEGPEDAPAPAASMGMEEGPSTSRRPAAKDEKQLKVNLTNIRDELDKLSAALGGVIAGGG